MFEIVFSFFATKLTTDPGQKHEVLMTSQYRTVYCEYRDILYN